MTVRNVVKINEEKCDGCGLCVPACAEGAIQIIDGKARLVSETYCDGLGACLGECPQGAISIEKREAADFSETAVKKHLAELGQDLPSSQPPPARPPADRLQAGTGMTHQHACPGSAMRQFSTPGTTASQTGNQPLMPSQLGHWPVQLMLVPPHAPFLRDADLLICADCVPFAVPDFHSRYLRGRAVLVGCPKLDDLQHYYEKFRAIFGQAGPRSITVLKMEVPCCHGIAQAAVQARDEVAPQIPVDVHTIGIRGTVVSSVAASETA